MTSNQIAYWGNVIKSNEADVKAREAQTKARQLDLDREKFKLQEELDVSEHMHEYGSIYNRKNKDIGLKQFKDTTQGVRNIFGAAGDILGPVSKAIG